MSPVRIPTLARRLFLALSLVVTFTFAAASLLLRPLWADVSHFLGTSFPVMLAAALLGAAACLALLALVETGRFGRPWHWLLFAFLDVAMIALLAYLLQQLGAERSVLWRGALAALPFLLAGGALAAYLWFVPKVRLLQRRGVLALFAALLAGGALLWSSLPWAVRLTTRPAVFVRQGGVVVAWGANMPAAGTLRYRLDEGGVQTMASQTDGLIDVGAGSGRIFLPLAALPQALEAQVEVLGVGAIHPTSVQPAGTAASEVVQVRFPAPGAALTLAVFSDLHEQTDTYAQLAAHVPWQQVDLAVFNGDLVNSVVDSRQVNDSILGLPTGGRDLPRLLVRGNHETRNANARLLDDWLLPPGGTWYQAFTLGNTFFIVLDSGEDKADSHVEYGGLVDFAAYHRQQAEWLAGVLASDAYAAATHRVVVVHIPLAGGEPTLEAFAPVAALLQENTAIDLMLSGHIHQAGILLPEESGLPCPVVFTGGSTPADAAFSLVHLGADGITVQVVDVHGQVLAELP